MGIKAGENASTLENAVSCWECQAPSTRLDNDYMKVLSKDIKLSKGSDLYTGLKLQIGTLS